MNLWESFCDWRAVFGREILLEPSFIRSLGRFLTLLIWLFDSCRLVKTLQCGQTKPVFSHDTPAPVDSQSRFSVCLHGRLPFWNNGIDRTTALLDSFGGSLHLRGPRWSVFVTALPVWFSMGLAAGNQSNKHCFEQSFFSQSTRYKSTTVNFTMTPTTKICSVHHPDFEVQYLIWSLPSLWASQRETVPCNDTWNVEFDIHSSDIYSQYIYSYRDAQIAHLVLINSQSCTDPQVYFFIWFHHVTQPLLRGSRVSPAALVCPVGSFREWKPSECWAVAPSGPRLLMKAGVKSMPQTVMWFFVFGSYQTQEYKSVIQLFGVGHSKETFFPHLSGEGC